MSGGGNVNLVVVVLKELCEDPIRTERIQQASGIQHVSLLEFY